MSIIQKAWAHGSHSSHSSHGSHNSHGNSDSTSGTTLSSGSTGTTTNTHTSTIGGVDYSDSFQDITPIGFYGGSGSLSQLTTIVNNVRSRLSGTTYTDKLVNDSLNETGSLPSIGTQITASGIDNLLKHGSATFPARYQPYTITINATAEGSSSSSAPASTTKTKSIEGVVSGSGDYNQNSWAVSARGIAGTQLNYTYTDNLASVPVLAPRVDTTQTISPAVGTKITKEQANTILSILQSEALQSRKGPESKSFSWSGLAKVSHSNSHSSHSNHSSCSRKVKCNIEDISFSALDILNKVNIVKFNYLPEFSKRISEEPGITHYGFIADDTPEELSTRYKDRMDYTNNIGILIKAVQELYEEIQEIKSNK